MDATEPPDDHCAEYHAAVWFAVCLIKAALQRSDRRGWSDWRLIYIDVVRIFLAALFLEGSFGEHSGPRTNVASDSMR